MRSLLLTAALLLLSQPALGQPTRVRHGVEALRHMEKGSLVGAEHHRRLREQNRRSARTRYPTRNAAERHLLHAIGAAPTRPAAAERILDRASAHARKEGRPFPDAIAAEIRRATRAFARARPRTLPTTEADRKALIPDRRRYDLEAVREMAEQYASTMRSYNGPRPGERIDLLRQLEGEGRVPYWDVDPARVPAEIVGLAERSPFRTADGKVRVFNHYQDKRRQRWLEKELGEPSGSFRATLTSSFRTVMVFPPDALPYMLKFSGDWFSPQKKLSREQVHRSVERSLHLRQDTSLTPEPSGLVLPSTDTTVIYRPLPLPRNAQLERGDMLLASHVLLDTAFGDTEAGMRIFGRARSQAEWLERELAPALARLLHHNLTTSFVHLELHAQNVDVLVDRHGRVRDIFVKDLLDMMHDPALESAGGRKPEATALLRDREWGDVGELSTRYSVATFHRDYLGQLRPPEGAERFRVAIKDQLLNEARSWADTPRARRYPEHAILFKKSTPLFEAIEAARDLFVKLAIERGFQPDHRVGRVLTNLKHTHGSGSKLQRVRALIQQWEHGWLGQVPVAIRRGSGGTIEAYAFSFD